MAYGLKSMQLSPLKSRNGHKWVLYCISFKSLKKIKKVPNPATLCLILHCNNLYSLRSHFDNKMNLDLLPQVAILDSTGLFCHNEGTWSKSISSRHFAITARLRVEGRNCRRVPVYNSKRRRVSALSHSCLVLI